MIPVEIPRARVVVTGDDGTRRKRLGLVEVTVTDGVLTAKKPGGAVLAIGMIVGVEEIGQQAWTVRVEDGSWFIQTQNCGCGGG